MVKRQQAWMWTAGVILVLILAGCTTQLVAPDASAPESEAVAEPAEDEAVDEVALLPAESPPFNTTNWSTDFSKRTVEWNEILSGGPPKDGIPSVDNPTFENVDAASEWLSERDPVIAFENNGEVRGYPLAILIWHEIVNDTVGDTPVAVTFCPLCNASIVFDATIDGVAHEFGTTGKLRNSDLVMYDRVTESWWQQFTGTGIVGEYTGRQLTFLPSQVLSFSDFADIYPDAQVMAVPTDFNRSYGRNPYAGYDSSTSPFLFRGEIDPRLAATERVVGVDLNGTEMAYSFSAVADAGAINDEVDGTPFVFFKKPETASALDSSTISEGRDVGSVGVFSRDVDGKTLTFSANDDGTFSDAETGSTWSISGKAIDGELAGTQLGSILSFDHFWFAWSAFFPETGLYEG